MSESNNSTGLRSQCRNLRSKEMYYESPGQEEDAFAGGAYWCLKTHEAFGPDGQPAEKKECCAGRSCFVG